MVAAAGDGTRKGTLTVPFHTTIARQGQTRLPACLSGAFCPFRLGLRQQACVSKVKNHLKIHCWQVRSSFAGAEMCPDEKKPAENTCRIVKGLDAVWAHFCPSKPCLPLSIDGSVKGNRQGSLSRSITRRSDQNRKIKYCFLFCNFASACQKSPNGLFWQAGRTARWRFSFFISPVRPCTPWPPAGSPAPPGAARQWLPRPARSAPWRGSRRPASRRGSPRAAAPAPRRR